MAQKIKVILGSVRFWMATVIAVFAIAKHYGVDEGLLTILQVWMATVLGVGTLDSVATKLNAK